MIRRLLNSVIETTLQPYQTEHLSHRCPFTRKETLHLNWLISMAPCFPIDSTNITILFEPDEFYETLLDKCLKAKERITLASLYIGCGQLERKLVENILANQQFKNANLKVNILLDYTRGSRQQDNSTSMLKPLVDKSTICLYHTPLLRGLKKTLAPTKYNELFGLQHMKLYIFDDTLIISGANLSKDYFTNRQDRYFVIKDKKLTDFYCGLVEKVQSFSLKLDKNDKLIMNRGFQLPYKGNMMKFVEEAGNLIESYLMDVIDEQNLYKSEGFDTWIFPLVQMGQLGIDQDASVTTRLLSDSPKNSTLCIATGYFNLTKDYMDTLIKKCTAECKLLMAHPDANGFKNASGIAGGIPDAYSLICQRFKEKLDKNGQGDRIVLKEYLREGWTYHAKGLWYYPPDSSLPCLTLIGSPNFGERSVKRDLETQLAIVTENEYFKEKLHKECSRLYKLSLPANTLREIPKWVYPIVYLFRGYF